MSAFFFFFLQMNGQQENQQVNPLLQDITPPELSYPIAPNHNYMTSLFFFNYDFLFARHRACTLHWTSMSSEKTSLWTKVLREVKAHLTTLEVKRSLTL
jgi:hypothetical protein